MKIAVCVKQTADLSSGTHEIRDAKLIVSGVSYVINSCDEYAIEEAIRLREECGGNVVLITFGPRRAVEALQMGMAMGADRAVHIISDTDDQEGIVTSDAISHALRNIEPDIVLCGAQSSDWGNAWVGPAVAQRLAMPCVSLVKKIERPGSIETNPHKIVVHQELSEGYVRIVEVVLPAVLTVQSGINKPRTPSLKDIMRSAEKEIESLNLSEIIKGENKVVSKVEIKAISPPKIVKKVIILKGAPQEVCTKLAQIIEERK